MYMLLGVFACVRVHAHRCKPVDTRGRCPASPLQPCVLRQSISFNPGFANLARLTSKLPGSACLCFPSPGVRDTTVSSF